MKIRNIKQRGGFVIVVVLSIVTMLAVILLCFNRQSEKDLLAAEGLEETYQAYNCARSGLNIAIAAINPPSADPGIVADKSFADLFSSGKIFNIDFCRCSVKITDESSRINLNKLIDEQGKPCKAAIEQFCRLIDVLNRQGGSHIDYGIVLAIIDWIDTDDNVAALPPASGVAPLLQNDNTGAESAYYMKLTPSYKCRNAPLETVDELLLVRGITSETYTRIRNYVTVCGDGKININSATKEVIESLSQKMDACLAQTIIDKRGEKFFDTVAQLRQFPWMTDAIYNEIRDKLTTKPTEQYYTITSRAEYASSPGTLAAAANGYAIIAVIKLDTQTKKVNVLWCRELNCERAGTYQEEKNG